MGSVYLRCLQPVTPLASVSTPQKHVKYITNVMRAHPSSMNVLEVWCIMTKFTHAITLPMSTVMPRLPVREDSLIKPSKTPSDLRIVRPAKVTSLQLSPTSTSSVTKEWPSSCNAQARLCLTVSRANVSFENNQPNSYKPTPLPVNI